MSYHEHDPRDNGYIALCLAITWYTDISADTAARIARGKSASKPGQKLTPELWGEIRKVLDSPNFANINSVVRRFRVNRYEIFDMYAKDEKRETCEEVLIVSRMESFLKRLKEMAESCPGANCEKCSLDAAIYYDDTTLCEILCDMEFDEHGKLKPTKNGNVRKCPQMSANELKGETERKTYRIYKNALERIDSFMQEHADKKQQDIVSAALLEYIERHKKSRA